MSSAEWQLLCSDLAYVGLSQECIYLARLLPYARHPPGVNSLHRIQFVQNSSQLNLDTIVLLDYL